MLSVVTVVLGTQAQEDASNISATIFEIYDDVCACASLSVFGQLCNCSFQFASAQFHIQSSHHRIGTEKHAQQIFCSETHSFLRLAVCLLCWDRYVRMYNRIFGFESK